MTKFDKINCRRIVLKIRNFIDEFSNEPFSIEEMEEGLHQYLLLLRKEKLIEDFEIDGNDIFIKPIKVVEKIKLKISLKEFDGYGEIDTI